MTIKTITLNVEAGFVLSLLIKFLKPKTYLLTSCDFEPKPMLVPSPSAVQQVWVETNKTELLVHFLTLPRQKTTNMCSLLKEADNYLIIAR